MSRTAIILSAIAAVVIVILAISFAPDGTESEDVQHGTEAGE